LTQTEPGYQIHHFVVIAQSMIYPPTQETEERSLISIPTFYLDPDRPRIVLSPPSIGQRHIPGTDLWACLLCKRERKVDETVEEGVHGLNENQAVTRMGSLYCFALTELKSRTLSYVLTPLSPPQCYVPCYVPLHLWTLHTYSYVRFHITRHSTYHVV
jgi:hypothetical protein